MFSLPPELFAFTRVPRTLFRAEVFDSFSFLLVGLLVGCAKRGTMRASAFAPAKQNTFAQLYEMFWLKSA